MIGEFFDLVPRDLATNLEFRRSLLVEARDNEKLQLELREMCRRDIAFWLGTFGWTYNPRKAKEGLTKIPFIPYPFQVDRVLKPIEEVWGKEDACVKKSRDMGLSWLMVAKPTHSLQFATSPENILLVSRNEDYVDKPGNPKALFWKIDFLLDHQPPWLLPGAGALRRVHLLIENGITGTVINGESTTGDVARGDRRTAILLDEYAAFDTNAGYEALSSTRDSTDCRLFNSTFKGAKGAFYDCTINPHIRQIVCPWWLHPEKAEGLYEEGGKKRSPWYDRQCQRAVRPQEIAQELDMDPLGADDQFFPSGVVHEHIAQHAKAPLHRGDLEDQDGSITFRPDINGPLQFWKPIGALGKPPVDRPVVIGVDVSAGTGASNSSASVVIQDTGEKIGEYTRPDLRPDQFAEAVFRLARWLRVYGQDPLVVHDAKGVGAQFKSRMNELGFHRFWVSRGEVPGVKEGVTGFHTSPTSKMALFERYRAGLEGHGFLNPCREALDECLYYIYHNNTVEHAQAISSVDPSGAKANHGDRAFADALAWVGCRSTIQRQQDGPPVIQNESLAWRRKYAEKQSRQRNRSSMRW